MAQRKPTKARTFQYGTICLNEVLNPNLRFNSLFSQNLFEEHKVIVDNFWSLKPQSFPNQNLEYAYGKTVSALAQHLQNLQNQLNALETQKFQNLKIQENQEKLIEDLKTSTVSTNQTSCSNSQPEVISLIKKSALLTEQYERLVVKNIIGVDNYSFVKTFFLQNQYNKVFKNQELLYKHFRTKNVGIKTGYMAYHDPEFFFVIYLAYVNMSVVNKENFDLVPQLMDQGILKNVFMNHISQIPENFPEKLKDILTYLFKTEKYIDISFETIPPLFQPDGSVVPAYHHVYIKHNKEPLIPQQEPEWEMTRSDEFPEFFTRYRAFQIYDLRPTRNKLFHLIGETKTMSIWRVKPLEHIIVPNPFITSEEQDFITELSVDILEPSSYLSDDALFWDNLDDESYHNLQNAMEA